MHTLIGPEPSMVIPYGTIVYAPVWRDVPVNRVGELGGSGHDGCLRVDDIGYGITGQRYDFFAGTRAMWEALESEYPSFNEAEFYVDSPECDHLR